MTLPRVLFVTGKGGTGKSTVAAALALARSRRRPTTLADLDRRMCAAAMLGVTTVDGAAAKVTESLEVVALGARAELDAAVDRYEAERPHHVTTTTAAFRYSPST